MPFRVRADRTLANNAAVVDRNLGATGFARVVHILDRAPVSSATSAQAPVTSSTARLSFSITRCEATNGSTIIKPILFALIVVITASMIGRAILTPLSLCSAMMIFVLWPVSRKVGPRSPIGRSDNEGRLR